MASESSPELRISGQYRRMLRGAITACETNQPLPALANGKALNLKGPVAIDTVGTIDNWQTIWKDTDMDRRASSKWATNPW